MYEPPVGNNVTWLSYYLHLNDQPMQTFTSLVSWGEQVQEQARQVASRHPPDDRTPGPRGSGVRRCGAAGAPKRPGLHSSSFRDRNPRRRHAFVNRRRPCPERHTMKLVFRCIPLLLIAALFAPATALAGKQMEVGLQDDGVFLDRNYYDWNRGFANAKSLHVTWLRINVLWSQALAPGVAAQKKAPKKATYDWSKLRRVDRRGQGAGGSTCRSRSPVPHRPGRRRTTRSARTSRAPSTSARSPTPRPSTSRSRPTATRSGTSPTSSPGSSRSRPGPTTTATSTRPPTRTSSRPTRRRASSSPRPPRTR